KNLSAHGITPKNTEFVVTVDEGDHFAGGIGVPQSGQPWLTYTHATCTNLQQCPTNQIREVGANIHALTSAPDPTAPTTYDIHADDAPTFYVAGQPAPNDPGVRKLERAVGGLTSPDPYVRDGGNVVQTVNLTQGLADPVEEATLHMANSDPNRTPT